MTMACGRVGPVLAGDGFRPIADLGLWDIQKGAGAPFCIDA